MTKGESVTIDAKTAESIFEEIETLQRAFSALRKKIAKLLPSEYGSVAWWEKEEAEADEDIKHGRVYGPFKNGNELLHSLHREASR